MVTVTSFATDGGIGILDRLNIGFDSRLAVRTERTRAHDSLQLVVLDLAVAVENDLVDELILADGDDERATGDIDADIGEVAGGIKTLYGRIDIGIAEALAGNDRDVCTDRLGADARSATNFDTVDRCGFSDSALASVTMPVPVATILADSATADTAFKNS